MPVVAVVNQKGGTGKTTLATNLASVLAENSRVLLIDADPQASSQNWAAGEWHSPEAMTVTGLGKGSLTDHLRTTSRQHDWTIIDGPPGISRTSAEAVRNADIVLIPAKPSPLDVWAAADVVEAVRARQKAATRLPRPPSSLPWPSPEPAWAGRSTPLLPNSGSPSSRPAPPSAWPTPTPSAPPPSP